MASLSTKISLYCTANSKTASFGPEGNVILQDDSDGNGPYIKTWDVTGLAKPTDADLTTYDAAATTEESNNQVIQTRKELYGSTAKQLEYIVENGVDAFVTKQQQIKTENPKS